MTTAQLHGVDVAHWQGSNMPWQWLVDNHAITFGACKVTEGTSYVDNTGSHNREQMRSVGLRWRGLYHYCRAGDPVGNVHHFQDTIGELDDGEFAMPDLESGMTDDAATVMTLLEKFSSVFPGRVGDYRGKYFGGANSHSFDPWPWLLAAYPWPRQVLPTTDRQPCVWQFAGGEHGVVVPGVRDNGWPIGAVDSDMVLIPAELDRICNLTASPPPVPVPPEEQHMAYYRDDRANGWQIWVVSTDAVGNVWTCPISDLPDRGKWEKVQPLVGDPPVRPLGSLTALMDAQNRPTAPTQLPADLVEHKHLGGVASPTGGVIR